MLQKNILKLLRKFPDLSQAWYDCLLQSVTDQEVGYLLTLESAREVETMLGLIEQLGTGFTEKQICFILKSTQKYPALSCLIPVFQKFPEQVNLIIDMVEQDDFFYQFCVQDTNLYFLQPSTVEELTQQISSFSKIRPIIKKVYDANQKELALDLTLMLIKNSKNDFSSEEKRLKEILSAPDDVFLDYTNTVLKRGKEKDLLEKYQDILFLKHFSHPDVQRGVYFFLQAHSYTKREKLLQWREKLGEEMFVSFIKADQTLRGYLKTDELRAHRARFYHLLERNQTNRTLLEVLDPNYFQAHCYEMPYDSFLEVFRHVFMENEKEKITAFLSCYQPLVKEKLRMIHGMGKNQAGLQFLSLLENALFSARTEEALNRIAEQQKGWFQESTGELWYVFRFAPHLLEDRTFRKQLYSWYVFMASEKELDPEWEMVPERLKQAVEEDQMRNLMYLMHTKELSHFYEIIEQEPEDAQISKGYQLHKPYQKKRK